MKTLKTFSLDIDVAKELEKEKNQSLLINSYLRKYFELDKKSLDEVEKELAELKTEEERKQDEEIKEDFEKVF